MAFSEAPLCHAFIVCDQVITDRKTGKKSVIGAFSRITANDFPACHPSLSLYVALSSSSGTGKVSVEFVQEKTDEALFRIHSNDLVLKGPNHVIELVFELRSLTFPSPGIYLFRLKADEYLVIQNKFVLEKKP